MMFVFVYVVSLPATKSCEKEGHSPSKLRTYIHTYVCPHVPMLYVTSRVHNEK